MQKDLYVYGDLTRNVLGVLFVIALILFSGWIMLPFLSATLWATTLVISTWPVLIGLQSRLGGSRGFATTILTVALLLLLVVPLTVAVGALVGNMDTIVAKADSLKTMALPPPPDWIAKIPLKGPKLYADWQEAASGGPGGLSAVIAPHSRQALAWLLARLGGVGGMILQFLLTVIISAILYANGETAAHGVRKFAERLAGAQGDRAVVLAGATIRGVAMGVIVTAIVQTIIATAGLLIVSVPAAGLIAAGVLILCIAQLGPFLVMVPVIIWKFYSGDTVGGIILTVFTLVAGTIDNFLRPFLIKKGADLPLLLIFSGVIGGLVGFGVMGIFVGPVILAVTYVLLREWVENRPKAASEEAGTASAQAVSG
ncbi:MAG TPA: AI-2E family transporter YdiK [Bryobacteraceae bacterium]|nr:AI-2E family transporter YdiK [Bryobacteraceae bacterium]